MILLMEILFVLMDILWNIVLFFRINSVDLFKIIFRIKMY